MESNNNNQSFWQFSDQLRLHGSNLANLSLNDSIWSVNSYGSSNKKDRRNFDIRVGGDIGNSDSKGSFVNETTNNSNFNLNPFSDMGWKVGSGYGSGQGSSVDLNGGFNKGVYSNSKALNYDYNNSINSNVNANQYYNNNGNFNVGYKGITGKNVSWNKGEDVVDQIGGKKKNKVVKKDNSNSNKDNSHPENNKSGVDKRFKTLPASESLPRNETVGGYIFVCNNDTMEENLKRQLFGLPPRYRDSVRQITPGLPLFLYNYSTHQLHGIYEAASFGGTNIDPTAWEDKKNPGESRFPAQVRVQTRKLCEPLDEDAFRPILHHYDGPKFRLELSIPEALSLLDIFAQDDA